jgi:hypothetical protein
MQELRRCYQAFMMGFLLVLLLLLLPPLSQPLLPHLSLLLLPLLLLLVARRGDALRAGPAEARNLRKQKGLAASLAREDKLSIC